MKIRNENGLYIATFKHRDGTMCMGYAPTFVEAMLYCVELVNERDAKR